MQELRRMQMFELNLGLGVEVRDEGSIATESNAIVLYNGLHNISLPSQAIIGNFENIASQEISVTQLCSEFGSSVEDITAIDVMNAQVKLSEGSGLANDPKLIPEEIDPAVEEAQHTEHENAAVFVDTNLEVEETKAYK